MLSAASSSRSSESLSSPPQFSPNLTPRAAHRCVGNHSVKHAGDLRECAPVLSGVQIYWDECGAAGATAGATLGEFAGAGVAMSWSMTERPASPALELLLPPSSGAAAPERRIRLCASGSMIGSSHGP